MTQSEFNALIEPLGRIIRKASGSKPMPVERITPANLAEMLAIIADIVAPKEDSTDTPINNGQKLPALVEPQIELSSRMGRRRTSRDPSRTEIAAAKLDLLNSLGTRRRK